MDIVVFVKDILLDFLAATCNGLLQVKMNKLEITTWQSDAV